MVESFDFNSIAPLPQAYRERFVDYLFMLWKGEVPPGLKPMIERQDGDVVVWYNGGFGMRGAIILGTPPYDANFPMLGFAFFGPFWPWLLKDVDKMVRKRWKKEVKKNEESRTS